jgi:inorganic triphosphatase YgiF
MSPRPSNVVSIYFDADGHKLRRKVVSLRVRRFGRRVVQTVKQENETSAGLFNRNEWEQDIRDGHPELDTPGDTAIAPLLTNKGVFSRSSG